MRIYRGFLLGAMRARWLTILVTSASSSRPSMALSIVPRQFFPASDRAELLVDLTAAAERLDLSLPRAWSTASRARCGMIPTSSAGAPISGAAPSGSTCRSTCSWPIRSSRRSLSSPRMSTARERLHAKLEKKLAEQFPERRLAYLAAGTRAAGRLAGAISRERPGSQPGARDRAPSLAGVAANPNTRLTNFDWMEPARELRINVDQDEARQLGVSSRDAGAGAQCAHLRHRRHPGARRHLPHRRHRAGSAAGRACRSRHCATCRCRCRTAAPSRSASSPPSSTARSIHWSGAATGFRRSPCRRTSHRGSCPKPWSMPWRRKSTS